MPDKLKVLVLNASLKHGPETSNTGEVANMLLKYMRNGSKIESETIRLADKNIPVGLGYKETEDDEWPTIVEKIVGANIVIFATPIWWGQRSSLMQRIIESLDPSFDNVVEFRDASWWNDKVYKQLNDD